MMERWSRIWRQQKLDAIHSRWASCEECPLAAARTSVVFGEGDPEAQILFCGEAPGPDEDLKGIPFIGKSGRLFNNLLSHAGIDSRLTYVTNVVACHPPENRDPTAAERNTCISRVHEIIYIVDPLIIVPVGKVAVQALCRKDWPITEVHGSVFSSPTAQHCVTGDRVGINVPGKVFPLKFKRDGVNHNQHLTYDMMPILHPSYLLREDNIDPETKKFPKNGLTHKTLNDLRQILNVLRQLRTAYEG